MLGSGGIGSGLDDGLFGNGDDNGLFGDMDFDGVLGNDGTGGLINNYVKMAFDYFVSRPWSCCYPLCSCYCW